MIRISQTLSAAVLAIAAAGAALAGPAALTGNSPIGGAAEAYAVIAAPQRLAVEAPAPKSAQASAAIVTGVLPIAGARDAYDQGGVDLTAVMRAALVTR
ncbi:hypothetical protein [Rubrimonas cliftonensis]|uniref:Uncharacterized protein n=1 Tax=Rubrimonas cliftonensis TaxID=89524 RepID=A0A1H4CKF6_9RHOB|nr:hypothetical protein [Rubrimonas cliftonensis]SEA60915.1 hypothetical protein SAMN05444370_107122 [Rubrimonas cliftonensis]